MTRRAAETVLSLIITDEATREAILGDLAEDAAAMESRLGSETADAWYWRQVFASAPYLVLRSIRRTGPRGWARVAIAAFGGYAVVVALVIATDILLALTLGFSPGTSTIEGAIVSLAFSVLGAACGGFAAAWIGEHAPVASAAALGLLFVAIGFLPHQAELPRAPLWYFVCLQLSAVPSTLLGTSLRCGVLHRSPVPALK